MINRFFGFGAVLLSVAFGTATALYSWFPQTTPEFRLLVALSLGTVLAVLTTRK
jgi:hypothetical protein